MMTTLSPVSFTIEIVGQTQNDPLNDFITIDLNAVRSSFKISASGTYNINILRNEKGRYEKQWELSKTTPADELYQLIQYINSNYKKINHVYLNNLKGEIRCCNTQPQMRNMSISCIRSQILFTIYSEIHRFDCADKFRLNLKSGHFSKLTLKIADSDRRHSLSRDYILVLIDNIDTFSFIDLNSFGDHIVENLYFNQKIFDSYAPSVLKHHVLSRFCTICFAKTRSVANGVKACDITKMLLQSMICTCEGRIIDAPPVLLSKEPRKRLSHPDREFMDAEERYDLIETQSSSSLKPGKKICTKNEFEAQERINDSIEWNSFQGTDTYFQFSQDVVSPKDAPEKCFVCDDNPPNIEVSPCNHVYMCTECFLIVEKYHLSTKKHLKCDICSNRIESYIRKTK